MNLMDRSTFLRRHGMDIETAIAYDQFLEWIPTLGMFVPCKDENNILIEGLCTEEEWDKGNQLLVFNDFELDDYGEDFACVTNGFCHLTFHSDGSVVDGSDGMELFVSTIDDLTHYELDLTHPW